MKSKFSCLLAVLCLLAGLGVGCGTLDRLYDRQVTSVPGPVLSTNVVYKTNVVVLAVPTTNLVTGAVTPEQIRQEVTPEIEIVQGPPRLVTNIVARRGVEGTIQAAAALPLPYAGTAALILGWAYSAYGHWRNKRLAQGLVVSVQAGRKFLNETTEGKAVSEKFKDTLQKSQALQGVSKWVKALLDRTIPDHTV